MVAASVWGGIKICREGERGGGSEAGTWKGVKTAIYGPGKKWLFAEEKRGGNLDLLFLSPFATVAASFAS